MKMRRNKFVPINSLKKTKVQFSTRLSGCLGEHQCQEFFERVNITRQSGICSKNKNNSFGDKRSNSFRQTLQLNIPFVANFSESKQFCICYPVHFFRKKLHSYDSEDNRLASVRVYFPASRMKNGNDFKVSLDLKKRIHMHPYQFEFVGYSSLLTLSLEDLSLAVFRAKSSSEKFKIMNSLPIPKILISQSVSTSQSGAPIFIGTERIYSRILKLIACSQSDAFKLKNDPALNSDSNLKIRKCFLKWIGLEDFLPPSSRIVFVRRISSDSGDSLGASILNSPGPKIKRSRSSIRMKQTKLDQLEEYDDDSKDNLYAEESPSHTVKMINNDNLDNKRPRGRPKKLLEKSNCTDESLSTKKDDAGQLVAEDCVKQESLQLKVESTSNSMTDSTSEEKYSVELSSCTTPDTNKSCSPVLINGTITMALSSTTSTLQSSTQTTNSNAVKNKRGRPRKYPLSLNIDRKIFKSHKDTSDSKVNLQDSDDGFLRNRKRSNTDTMTESNSKLFKSSNSSISSNDGNQLKILAPSSNSFNLVHNNDRLDCSVSSIWRPLKHPLAAPDPVVPFIKQLSNTGLSTDRKLKSMSSVASLNYCPTRTIPSHSVSEFCKPNSNFMSADNPFTNINVPVPSPTKSILGSTNGSQYLLPNPGFSPLMAPPIYNNSLLLPLINTICNSNSATGIGSLFPSNQIKHQSMSFYDSACRQLYSNSHFLTNDNSVQLSPSSTISHGPQLALHPSQILANKFDTFYSWPGDFHWKY